ncbi:hypothetical protein OROMI_002730 [Orobanche minor]
MTSKTSTAFKLQPSSHSFTTRCVFRICILNLYQIANLLGRILSATVVFKLEKLIQSAFLCTFKEEKSCLIDEKRSMTSLEGSEGRGSMLVQLLLSSFVLSTFVSSGNAGVTSAFIRNDWPSVDIPLDNEVFAFPKGDNAPQQIHITQGDYDGKAVIISWVTPSEPGSSKLRYGLSEGHCDLTAEGTMQNYTFYNYKSGYIHQCLVDDLQYDSKYYYEIGDGDSSRKFWFQTPPKINPDASYKFGIIEFSDNSDREAERITFDGKVVHGSTFFRYLGSIIQKDGELDGDVAHRIKAGWLKWKSATGVLCDPDMPHRLKGKFYRTAIRPALLYGTECWAVKQCHVQKMNVAEMRMLRWMCGHTKKDRLRNEVIREKVRVASIEDKMMENRLRWFGHVRRRPVDAPVRRLESWGTSNIVKGRGRPKKTWIKLIENDMRLLGIGESMAMERQIWRERIRVVDEI